MVRDTLTSQGATPEVLATLLHTSLSDGRALRADRAVVTAAVYDPRLRELARHWSDEMVSSLTPTYGSERAQAAAVFIDGVVWHAQTHEKPLTLSALRRALSLILESAHVVASAPAEPAV